MNDSDTSLPLLRTTAPRLHSPQAQTLLEHHHVYQITFLQSKIFTQKCLLSHQVTPR